MASSPFGSRRDVKRLSIHLSLFSRDSPNDFPFRPGSLSLFELSFSFPRRSIGPPSPRISDVSSVFSTSNLPLASATFLLRIFFLFSVKSGGCFFRNIKQVLFLASATSFIALGYFQIPEQLLFLFLFTRNLTGQSEPKAISFFLSKPLKRRSPYGSLLFFFPSRLRQFPF